MGKVMYLYIWPFQVLRSGRYVGLITGTEAWQRERGLAKLARNKDNMIGPQFAGI